MADAWSYTPDRARLADTPALEPEHVFARTGPAISDVHELLTKVAAGWRFRLEGPAPHLEISVLLACQWRIRCHRVDGRLTEFVLDEGLFRYTSWHKRGMKLAKNLPAPWGKRYAVIRAQVELELNDEGM